MACMCGDTHCSSCGPAQGNWRCIICGAWADDGCEHIDEETGRYKQGFVDELQAAYESERRAAEEEAHEYDYYKGEEDESTN